MDSNLTPKVTTIIKIRAVKETEKQYKRSIKLRAVSLRRWKNFTRLLPRLIKKNREGPKKIRDEREITSNTIKNAKDPKILWIIMHNNVDNL